MAPRHYLFGGMLLFTLAHLGLVVQKTATPSPITQVSSLEAPVRVAALPAPREGPVFDVCRVVVAFDPGCPACNKAAQMEEERSEPMGIPVTWVAQSEMDAELFRRVHPTLGITHQPGAFNALGVQGVPAAFLVKGETVLQSWRYTGEEGGEELSATCADAPEPAVVLPPPFLASPAETK